MHTKRIEFRQQRDFSEKISATFDFLRINFRPLLRSIIFIAGPLILLGIGIFVVFASRLSESYQQLFEPNTLVAPSAIVITVGGLFIFFIVIYTAVVAVIYTYLQLYLDENPDIGEFQTIFDYTKRNFSIVLITTLALLFFLSLVVFAMSFVLVLVSIGGGTSTTSIMVLLGLFVFLPVFFYIAIALSFVYFIRVIEGIGMWDSIVRSFTLVQGHWWATFGYVLAISFIQGFMGYIFQIPLLIYSVVFPLVSLSEKSSSAVFMSGYVVLGLFYLFGSQILNAFNLTAIAFQYFNLVETKEGVGLMNRINKVGGDKKKEEEEDF